jgi:hypothetical protein
MGIIAIIVTHNLSLDRFRLVLRLVAEQVNHLITVDNDSHNKGAIKNLCTSVNNRDFVEVGLNSRAAHALRVGI